MAKWTGRRRAIGTYRSGLEKKVAEYLTQLKVTFKYEGIKIKYIKPESYHTYTPDFVLPNGIIVETKGIFDSEDRKKHVLVREQQPHYDIRFVFTNSKTKLYKGSKTKYSDWCTNHGFQYADKLIPRGWIDE